MGSSLWVRQQSHNVQASDPVPLILDFLNPKSVGFDISADND